MIREVTLLRKEVRNLLNDLKRIEASDGKPGFCRKELKKARDLLTSAIGEWWNDKKVILKKRQSITARSLYEFLSQLRKAYRELPKAKNVCRKVGKNDPKLYHGPSYNHPLPDIVCHIISYSLQMTIYEGKNNFEVKMEQVREID